MPTLSGEVQRVTYENEETGFRVLKLTKCQPPQSSSPGNFPLPNIVVVGVFAPVAAGSQVRVTGNYVEDTKHGRQFRADSLVVMAPESLDGIERYLGSGVIPGLGPGFAKRIVETFGLKTLQVLDGDSAKLRQVPGLKGKRLERIQRGWADQRRLSNVMLLLQTHGASLSLANRIVQKYDDRAALMVERHPYRLAIEVRGIGFKTADRLAQSLGLGADHPERVQAGVLHVLGVLSESGHVYATRAELGSQCARLLEIDEGHIAAGIDALWASERVVVEGEAVYLSYLHRAEVEVARHLTRLLAASGRELPNWQRAIQLFEKASGHTLSAEQRGSVESAAREKVLVITGGPGVGKTTIVLAVLKLFELAKLKVSLAAPTGRAAKRLGESTRQNALTLHRLLEYDPHLHSFRRDADSPLDAQAVVVDEASMVDVQLAQSLLAAMPTSGRLVLVGDVDQLPSVGPGAFLHDVIASGVVPTLRLRRIFRQTEASSIVRNAHAILQGEEPSSDDAASERAEFFVIPKRDPEEAADVIRQLLTKRIPQRFGLDPRRDIQVLTPMHRGAAGTIALNQLLQAALNPGQGGIESRGEMLSVGDKVMQIENDYDKEVFNGDLGRVAELDAEAGRLGVDFDGRIVRYVGREIDALRLAYATSIHKSQGSEYPAVVIPLQTSHFPMLSRNLLYTAVTRAKRLCVLVADPRALRIALGELRRERRCTGLTERLRAGGGPALLDHDRG
ncbi:MAG: ATP-dependent RecD-like DNA helicase [Deltaproteobacteria bacterium]